MKPGSIDFARLVYTCAIDTRWEWAAYQQLMHAVDAAKKARRK